MKLVNFASFDPVQKERNIKGLSNISKLDLEIWQEFYSDWEQLAFESQNTLLRLQDNLASTKSSVFYKKNFMERETETKRFTRVRLVQGFFRDTVLASYDYKCSFCELGITQLLLASHIIPWKDNITKRADPTNGLCLCALHDKAFDRGILGIDDNYRILLSHVAKKQSDSTIHRVGLLETEGKQIILPSRFKPDLNALSFHRLNIFIK